MNPLATICEREGGLYTSFIWPRKFFYKFALYVAIVGVAVILMQVTGFAGFPPLSLPAQPLG